MGWFSSKRVAEMLACEKPLLEKIVGSPTYEIEDADPNEATVRSPTFVLQFEYDRDRVGDVMVYLSAGGEASEPIHPLETWARFLGEDRAPVPVNKAGKVTVSAEQQIHDKLVTADRLVKEIFSDPRRARDASAFADGYNAAYNDWASGNGSWISSA